ncbi:MAG: hypothetical protein K0R85_55 [Devosia sp.]|jgi:hypothetical protein|nr:hypothetical protein [Devosia sp.]
MNTGDMKSAILAKVTENGALTFVDIEAMLEISGEHSLSATENVYFWDGISKEAVQAIFELRNESKIFYYPVDPIFYLSQGGGLKLPIARTLAQLQGKSKKLHWLPVVLTTRHPLAA